MLFEITTITLIHHLIEYSHTIQTNLNNYRNCTFLCYIAYNNYFIHPVGAFRVSREIELFTKLEQTLPSVVFQQG